MILYDNLHLAEYTPTEKFVRLNSLKGNCHSFLAQRALTAVPEPGLKIPPEKKVRHWWRDGIRNQIRADILTQPFGAAGADV